jgi:coenzyme Q-binding protein COQ10
MFFMIHGPLRLLSTKKCSFIKLMGPTIAFSSFEGKIKSHHERRLMPYTVDEMYDVIADVDEYKNFLPWCKGSKVIERDAATGKLKANLTIGYGVFTERYTSLVSLNPPKSIKATSTDTSILDLLETEWSFQPSSKEMQCWVTFKIRFRFKSPLYDGISDILFEEVVKNMTEAFSARCQKVYSRR